MCIKFSHLVYVDKLQGKQYVRQMLNMLEAIQGANYYDLQLAKISISLLNTHGCRQHIRICLNRWIKIRQQQLKTPNSNRNNRWNFLFISEERKSFGIGKQTQSQIKAIQSQKQGKIQFLNAAEQFQRMKEHIWQIFQKMFRSKLPLELGLFYKELLPFWLRLIRPIQKKYFEDLMKIWQTYREGFWSNRFAQKSDKKQFIVRRKKQQFLSLIGEQYYDYQYFSHAFSRKLQQALENDKQYANQPIKKEDKLELIRSQIISYVGYQRAIITKVKIPIGKLNQQTLLPVLIQITQEQGHQKLFQQFIEKQHCEYKHDQKQCLKSESLSKQQNRHQQYDPTVFSTQLSRPLLGKARKPAFGSKFEGSNFEM